MTQWYREINLSTRSIVIPQRGLQYICLEIIIKTINLFCPVKIKEIIIITYKYDTNPYLLPSTIMFFQYYDSASDNFASISPTTGDSQKMSARWSCYERNWGENRMQSVPSCYGSTTMPKWDNMHRRSGGRTRDMLPKYVYLPKVIRFNNFW